MEPTDEPINELIKKDVMMQTDKRKMSDKQRLALQNGRELYHKNKMLYKKFVEEQNAKELIKPIEEPVSVPVVEPVKEVKFSFI